MLNILDVGTPEFDLSEDDSRMSAKQFFILLCFSSIRLLEIKGPCEKGSNGSSLSIVLKRDDECDKQYDSL